MALRVFRKKWVLITTIAVTALVLCIGTVLFLMRQPSDITANNETPTFSVLLPSGKNAEALGGLALVSPPNTEPVYTYSDTLGGVKILVSQQKIPDTFKGAVDANVEQLAKKDNASRKLDAKGTTAFIGKSTKGPQSVYFSKNDLLIFIKSQNEISDSDWIQYVASLKK